MAGKPREDQATEEEKKLKVYEQAFKLFDKNGDRGISMREMGTVIRACGGNPTEADLKCVWTKMDLDKDKDGTISFDEFIQVMKEHTFTAGRDIRKDFEVFDTNKDGYITTEELKKVMTDLGEPLNQEELDELLKDFDIDKDGRFNYQEFLKMMDD
ncbi:neo-calmodulin-like [Lineus longissimus]|uniref:neo-calmodulin-like n=1 Tax=Lineus longissimus TaxID=88925 RepID=UPI002B4ED027